MNFISERINQLTPSATLVMSQKSAELRASGVDVINMSIGEPDFNTPEFIKEAAKRAIDENYTHYAPVPGYWSLREAISKKLKKENGLDYSPEQIVVGNGAKQELCNALMATVNAGDEVIIPVPAWVSYVDMVKIAEGVPVTVAAGMETDFKITAEQLENAITPRSRVLMFNSPSNPTGSVYSYQELSTLVEVLERHPDILVLADDIYEHINYIGGAPSLSQFESLRDRVMIVNGVSKAYAMTGWRIGWMAAPSAIAKGVTKLQGQYTSCVSSIAMKAAEAAYNGPQQCVEDMRRAFEQRRNLIVELAKEVPGWVVNKPDGAFYLFPGVSDCIGKRFGEREIKTTGDYVLYLLEQAHVAAVDGAAFFGPGHIRLSYATSEDNIREAMRRIREATVALR